MISKTKHPLFLTALVVLGVTVLSSCSYSLSSKDSVNPVDKPNIIIFYVDDLGYGDVGAYGATEVATPNIDALANNGIRFTDAHSSSATCTPSRYSLLTGEYAFRNQAAVLQGDAPLIIDTKKPTLPRMLKKAGYTTAVVGKWHLGLGDGIQPVDWNKEVKPGPRQVGFDYSFLLPSTGDRVPSVYMENGNVLNLSESDPLNVSYVEKIGERPTGTENPDLLRQQADPQHSNTIINGISRIGFMQGGKSSEWKDEDFYKVFTDKANEFIEKNQTAPFFLFFSFHDIHVPRLPNSKFVGKTQMGPRGDAIVQMDYITGQIINKLKALNELNNTIIIFTSDNGPVLNDGYEDQAVAKLGTHQPTGIYRGGKYSAYEAGTRVPTIVHYPEKVTPGVSHSLVSQVDIYASLASMLNVELDLQEAIDSQDHIRAWLTPETNGRKELIEESYTLSIRQNQWKLIAASELTQPWVRASKDIEAGLSRTPQLFDLSIDPSERQNLANTYPHKVELLQSRLDQIVAQKRRVNRLE